ncbi:MAG: hypothetical protein ACK52J_04470 [bacterium]
MVSYFSYLPGPGFLTAVVYSSVVKIVTGIHSFGAHCVGYFRKL